MELCCEVVVLLLQAGQIVANRESAPVIKNKESSALFKSDRTVRGARRSLNCLVPVDSGIGWRRHTLHPRLPLSAFAPRPTP